MQPAGAAEATGSCLEAGELRIDPGRRTLMRGHEPIHLTPKEFEILILLLEHPDRVVRKEELMARVWPDACVEEGNLTQNISLLRKQLGETADGKPYIETVPKLGYRIGVPVRVCADPQARRSREVALRVLWSVLFLLWSGLCFWLGQKFGAKS